MEALPSGTGTFNNITVDLFAKDAGGRSRVNSKNVEADALVFNSQLLVVKEGMHKFDYSINIGTFSECYNSGVCFNCVYDLEIRVKDDCGKEVTPSWFKNKKAIGNFQADGNGNIVSFVTSCTPYNTTAVPDTFSCKLSAGNYTVSKILTVNKEARDYYVGHYLATDANGNYINLSNTGECALKTQQTFTDIATANLDTSDCNISCTQCVQSMMVGYNTIEEARDAYVADGKGTELEFDYLIEECNAPCKEIGICEASYEMMLMDVSPDGQYAEFQPTVSEINGEVIQPDMRLSVLNIDNKLPKNLGTSSQGNWKYPKIQVNTTNYAQYLESETNVRTRIALRIADNTVGISESNFIPEVDVPGTNPVTTGLKYFLDASTGTYYTYPEYLKNVKDFTDNWNDGWARSLVQYHPEYCYYESCLSYKDIKSNSGSSGSVVISSDEFDAILENADTYQKAVTAKLIKQATSTGYVSAVDMVNFLKTSSIPSNTLLDPFYSSTLFNVSSNGVNYNYATLLNSRVFPSGLTSLIESSAIAARCGTQYYGNIAANCKQFGRISGSTPTSAETAILDKEWNLLKNMYLSEKQKLQKQRDDDRARGSCNGYNGCIGNDNYNPYTSGMISWTPGGFWNQWFGIGGSYGGTYFSPTAPCGIVYAEYYINKKKRFNAEANLPAPTQEEMDYQHYLISGQCPLAKDVENLLSSLASTTKLTSTAAVALQGYGEFSRDLYDALKGVPSNTFTNFQWSSSQSGQLLTGTFSVSAGQTMGSCKTITLDKTNSGISNWSSVFSIRNLKYTTSNGSIHSFTAVAAIKNPAYQPSNPSAAPEFFYKNIKGSTCIAITGCNLANAPPANCRPNDLAVDLSNLWSALIANGQMNPASSNPTNISGTSYNAFLTNTIKNALGITATTIPTGSPVVWSYVAGTPAKYYLYQQASVKLEIIFNASIPAGTKVFSDIKSGTTTGDFSVKALDQTGVVLATISTGKVNLVTTSPSATVGVAMGTCAASQSVMCQGDPYQLRKDLEELLQHTLLTKKPNASTGNIDLTLSPKFTDLIKTYISPTLPHASGMSKYDDFSVGNGKNKEQLYFNFLCACKIILSHKYDATQPTANQLKFDKITSLEPLKPWGEVAFDNNYYRFYMRAKYVISGVTSYDTLFGESCLPIKWCIPPVVPDSVSPAITYADPCVVYQMNIAAVNATNAYNAYKDSIASYIGSRYMEHCITATETFTDKYKDKEYHFTLYYYDQAGNLVKTVPPEGVRLVDLSVYGTAINADRTNNTKKVFTDHTLATTYHYNSLNQLVRQSMPDHEMMDIWEYKLPNGLDSRLKVTATQFVNSTKGYLSGYINLNATTKRGYLYTTEDAGATWSRMSDLVGSDLKKIHMADLNIGYAVGTNGTIVRTTDGGSNWDLLPLVTDNASAPTTALALNDIYFINKNNGIAVGENGYVVTITTTTAGTVTATSSLPNVFTGLSLTSVTYDGLSYYVSGNTATEGKLYKGTISNPTTTSFSVSWSASTAIRSTDLSKIHMLTTGTLANEPRGFAVGTDGTLLSTADGGVNWTTIATGIEGDFKDIYFKTPTPSTASVTEGVAIIADGSSSKLYKTSNGGNSWTLLSGATENYNGFYFYQNDKGYAVGNNGKVKRIVFGATAGNVGLVNIPTTTAMEGVNFNACYFETADKGWVVGNSSKVYYTTNAISTAVSWTEVNTGTSGTDANFRDVYFGFGSNLNSGLLLGVSDKLYRIVGLGVSGTVTHINTVDSFADIDATIGITGSEKVYAYNKTTKALNSVSKNGITSSLSSLTPHAGSGPQQPLGTNVYTINAKNTGSEVLVAGKNGDNYKATVGVGAAWVENSKNVKILPIQDVQAAGNNVIYAVGKDGTLLQSKTATAVWQSYPSKTAQTIHAIKFNTTATSSTVPTTYLGLLAGDNGLMQKVEYNASPVAPALEVNTVGLAKVTDNHLYDVALKSNNKGYIAGAKGTLLYVPTINPTGTTGIEVLEALPKPSEDLKGLCLKTLSDAVIAVGDNTSVYQYNTTSGAKVKTIHPLALNDVHFVNPQNGYTVGDKGTIKHTTDGGISWKTIFAKQSSNTTLLDITTNLNGVWTSGVNIARIVGNGGYLAVASGAGGLVLTYLGGVGTADLYDIAYRGTKGYIVGSNAGGGAPTAYRSSGASWAAISGAPNVNLRAIHIFQDDNFIAVGDNKAIHYCKNPSSPSWENFSASVGTNFSDVYFHDDRNGYVAGGTTVLRCSIGKNIAQATNSGSTPDVVWQQKALTGTNGLSSADASVVNVVTIDFSSRYNGFLGGYFTDNRTNANYARLLNDESGLFSVRLWYDRLGRVILSQNTKQYNRKNLTSQQGREDYSYTRYDALGRILEAGELTNNTTTDKNFASIFGVDINGMYNPNAIDENKYNVFLNNSTRREVTKTYYDIASITGLPGTFTQDNLRKRVVHVTYEDVDDNNAQTYQHATHYTYDIHGNVKTLLQDNPTITVANNSQRFKRVDYEYDLISGNVNVVRYQDGQADCFYHYYRYDADNRVTEVYTSKYPHQGINITGTVVGNETDKDPLWDRDAKYMYYAHGPLARVELGDNKVQGMDYVYTMQGWLKATNTNTLNAARDMGGDGKSGSKTAQDAFGYSLSYFANDYTPIDPTKWTTANRFEAVALPTSQMYTQSKDLYNGNIRSMVTAIAQPKVYTGATNEAATKLPQGTVYSYDQLNRLKEMKAYAMNQTEMNANQWQGTVYDNRYHNKFNYDANGNITYQERADGKGNVFDSLHYRYKLDANNQPLQNRLYHVNDKANSSQQVAYALDDIEDQGVFNSNANQINTSNNYEYDEIGDLVKDKQEEIDRIEWMASGKIKKIIRTASSTKPHLEFKYDVLGNRLAKIEKPNNSSGENGEALDPTKWITTYYVRESGGKELSVYKLNTVSGNAVFKQMEKEFYGSTRLGTEQTELVMTAGVGPTANPYTRTLGNKNYEGVNHLSNVLAVVSDKKIPVTVNGTTIDHFDADIKNVFDYTPFGAPMNERTFAKANSDYRYGFQGQEMDDEVKGSGNSVNFTYRVHDTRLGRFLSVDPLAKSYPYYTPYQFAGNTPIKFIELEGLEPSENPDNPENQNFGDHQRDPTATIKEIFRWSGGSGTFEQAQEAFNRNFPKYMQGTNEPTQETSGELTSMACSEGSYATDTDNNGAEKCNLWVNKKGVFNQNEINDWDPQSLVNFLLGCMINGKGPENIKFPTNGSISNELKDAGIVSDALHKFYQINEGNSASGDLISLKQQMSGNAHSPWSLTFNGVFDPETFLGSATVSITKLNDQELMVEIFNVTSITSGDIAKHLLFATEYPVSVVRNPSLPDGSPQNKWGNISQNYSFTVPIEPARLIPKPKPIEKY